MNHYENMQTEELKAIRGEFIDQWRDPKVTGRQRREAQRELGKIDAVLKGRRKARKKAQDNADSDRPN